MTFRCAVTVYRGGPRAETTRITAAGLRTHSWPYSINTTLSVVIQHNYLLLLMTNGAHALEMYRLSSGVNRKIKEMWLLMFFYYTIHILFNCLNI